MPGDQVLAADGNPWDVIRVDHRHRSNKATMTREGKEFTFTPEHALPVQRKAGEVGAKLDILRRVFPGLEILR